MKRIVFVIVMAFIATALMFSSCSNQAKDAKAIVKASVSNDKVAYSCPMDKGLTSDKPGKCPKCGMDLVKTGKVDGKSCNCPAACGCSEGKACSCGSACVCPMCGKDGSKKSVKTSAVSVACPCPVTCGCSEGKTCSCGSACVCPMCGKGVAKNSVKISSLSYACPANCGCESGSPCTCPKCGADMIKKTSAKV